MFIAIRDGTAERAVTFVLGYFNFVGIHKEIQEIERRQPLPPIRVIGKLALGEHGTRAIDVERHAVCV